MFGVAPEHAEFLGGETMLENRRDDVGRRFLVGEPMQRDADVRLGLAVAQRQPILFALTDKVVECSIVCSRKSYYIYFLRIYSNGLCIYSNAIQLYGLSDV